MKRKGLRITVIILTILSYISVIFSAEFLIDFVKSFDGATELVGFVAIILYLFVIAIFVFFVIGSLYLLSSISILLCSISLHKSISYNNNIVFDIVFMTLNFITYVFSTGILLMLFNK